MARLIVRRLFEAVPVLFVIITITFFMVRLAPGGPFDDEKSVSAEVQAQLDAYYHLDEPLSRQYFGYLGGLLKGDLGPSFKYSARSVNEFIRLGFPVSVELGVYGLIVALTVGLLAGTMAALRPNTVRDYAPMSFAMIGICVPNFVLGPLLILIFGLWMDWLPVSGWEEPQDKILPALTLGAMYAAYIARLTRGGMLEILSHDFIRTARAKGLSRRRVLWRHALRGGILPVVAYLGPMTAYLVSGSFVVETIFQIPGLGRFFVEAAFNRDYTLILGLVIFYATIIVFLNLLADLAQVWLDPRLRNA